MVSKTRRPKKGDRLVYTGPLATAADMAADFGVSIENCEDVAPPPPGTVVRFHTNRFHGPSVTVLLDRQPGETEDLYADWPIAETMPESSRSVSVDNGKVG